MDNPEWLSLFGRSVRKKGESEEVIDLFAAKPVIVGVMED